MNKDEIKQDLRFDCRFIEGYSNYDDGFKDLIAEVLSKLPKEVQENVLGNVYFILVGVYGMERNNDPQIGIEIIINTHRLNRRTKAEKEAVIAHEIAHFQLKHHNDFLKPYEKKEKEANDLVEEWKFDRKKLESLLKEK